MVLGPSYKRDAGESDSDNELPSEDEVSAEACAAGQQLAASLQRAEEVTGGFVDEQLSYSLVDAALSACLVRLAATGCWGKANERPSRYLWQSVGCWLEHGRLPHRARTKPLGYAGDFELLGWICDEARCEHPLGRLLDRYFLSLASPQAVRHRNTESAAAAVSRFFATESRPFRMTSIGSGPARDFESALGSLPAERRDDVSVTLLDIDPAALDFARCRLERFVSPEQINTLRENLYRLPDSRRRDALAVEQDFIVCLGFFDYLDDRTAAQMLSLFWQRLRPGGQLLVGNFAPHCPTRAFMEWIGNWYLIYRTAEEMDALARAAGIPPEQFQITAEKTGCDLFINARK